MASIIQIYETQSVIYTDNTSGGLEPYSRMWSFSGGNISSATGPTAQVTYSNTGSYTATLTVTDFNNVTASNIINNGIEVLIPSVNAEYTPTSASLKMGQSFSITNTSTGLPENPTSYQWIVGGTDFATTSDVSISYNDWNVVPGANIAAKPGSSVSVSLSLEATSSYSSDTTSSSFTVSKVGLAENSIINRELALFPYVSQCSISNTTDFSAFLGYPTNSYVYEFDFSSASPPRITGFHSTLENATITLTGLSGDTLFLDGGVGRIRGYIIVEDYFYTTGDPEIVSGKYIYPSLGSGPPTKLYFADDGLAGNLTDLILNSNYTISLVDEILNNVYPQLNSTQSDYYGALFPDTIVSSGFNPVVYSPIYFINNGATGAEYEVIVEVDGNSATCTFNDNGGVGNEPGGNDEFYVMQDVGGTGAASQLNSAIAASIPGGTASIEFTAVESFNINSSGTPSDYYGLKMEVKEASIQMVQIRDNSSSIASTYGIDVMPFAYTYRGSPTPSCSGVPYLLDLTISDYFLNGKNIQYGESIF